MCKTIEKMHWVFYSYFFNFIFLKPVKRRIPFSWNSQGETFQELVSLFIFVKQLLNSSYFLTSYSWVFLEKLTDRQLVKNFPAFYGTQRFITAFTRASYLSLSWAISIQSLLTSRFLIIYYNIILPCLFYSSKCSLSIAFPYGNRVFTHCMHFSSPPYVLQWPAHFILLDLST